MCEHPEGWYADFFAMDDGITETESVDEYFATILVMGEHFSDVLGCS